jgi:hypothetical protein
MPLSQSNPVAAPGYAPLVPPGYSPAATPAQGAYQGYPAYAGPAGHPGQTGQPGATGQPPYDQPGAAYGQGQPEAGSWTASPPAARPATSLSPGAYPSGAHPPGAHLPGAYPPATYSPAWQTSRYQGLPGPQSRSRLARLSILAWLLVLAGGIAAATASIAPWITASVGSQSGSLLGTELDRLSSPPVLGQATGYAVIILGVTLAALGLGGLLFSGLRLPIGAVALAVAVATGAVVLSAGPSILTEINNMTAGVSDVSVMFGVGFVISAAGAAGGVLGATCGILAARR